MARTGRSQRGTRARPIALQVFLDESRPGKSGQWDVFTVGGVAIDDRNLSRFDREWKRALRLAPVPLERFHMTDWENSQGDYRGWEQRDRFRLFDALCTVVTRSVQFAMSCSIDLRGYAELSLDDRQVIGSTKYGICFQSCFAQVNARLQADDQREPVAYVLDQTPPMGGVSEILELWRLFWTDRIASVNFVDSRRFPALQAADIVAYEMAKQAAHELGRAAQMNQRKSLRALLQKAPHLTTGHGVFDASGLRDLVTRVRQGAGVLPTKRVRRPLNPKHFQ